MLPAERLAPQGCPGDTVAGLFHRSTATRCRAPILPAPYPPICLNAPHRWWDLHSVVSLALRGTGARCRGECRPRNSPPSQRGHPRPRCRPAPGGCAMAWRRCLSVARSPSSSTKPRPAPGPCSSRCRCTSATSASLSPRSPWLASEALAADAAVARAVGLPHPGLVSVWSCQMRMPAPSAFVGHRAPPPRHRRPPATRAARAARGNLR